MRFAKFLLAMAVIVGLSNTAVLAKERKRPEAISRPAPPLGLYYYCIDQDNIPADGYLAAVTIGYDVTQWGAPRILKF